MGENARIKNDIRKVEEYGGGLNALNLTISNQSLSTSLKENEPRGTDLFAKDGSDKSNQSRRFVGDTKGINTPDKNIKRSLVPVKPLPSKSSAHEL